MDKPPWFVTFFILFHPVKGREGTLTVTLQATEYLRDHKLFWGEKSVLFCIYLVYQSVMLPFIPNLMNMLISTFLNLSGYLNLFIQAVFCSYYDLWVWVCYQVIGWMFASDVLFKGKLEVTRCHTDTGHMHVGLERISVYSHYSVTLRIAVLTPPTTT